MKVLAALILAIGSTAALGSGPYLPRGWKPEGPAFYLPSEDQKPSPINLVLQESEGSSSDFLREYGPPNAQVSQSLPQVSTEQPFVVLEAKFGQDDATVVDATTEVTAELTSEINEETQTSTELVTTEEKKSESTQEIVQGKYVNLEVDASVVEESSEAEEVAVSDEVNAKIQTEVQKEVKDIEEGVRNIAEAIVSLEKESELEQVPEGFLEYGPPGFREYGPPNQNLLRSYDEEKTESEKIDSNETRRRRFSPKFRSTKKHH